MKTAGADVTPSLRALLGGSVDYAGLFPPAALALEPALDNHAAYVRSPEAWMLGCFVLPVAKLAEAGRLLAGRFDISHPLRLSLLGSKTNSGSGFLEGLRAALRGASDLRERYEDAVSVEQIETPLPVDVSPGPALDSLLWEAARLIGGARDVGEKLRAFWEVPFSDDLPAVLLEIAEHNAWISAPTPRPRSDAGAASGSPARPRCHPFGAKLRTGGLEASAFPSTAQLAAALAAARKAGIALKFTAGLHHPFRRFDAGVAARMHGFVNVFAAGIFLRQPGFDAALAQSVLEDEDPADFRFAPDGLRWRDWHVPTATLSEARQFITSFGSCSFDEPRDDLRAAGLLS